MNVINELRREGTFDHTIAGIDVEGNEMEGIVELLLFKADPSERQEMFWTRNPEFLRGKKGFILLQFLNLFLI